MLNVNRRSKERCPPNLAFLDKLKLLFVQRALGVRRLLGEGLEFLKTAIFYEDLLNLGDRQRTEKFGL